MSNDNHDVAPRAPFPSAEAEGDRWGRREADRAAHRSERAERRGRRHFGWLWGGVLVVLGVELLLENMGLKIADNWWALFILIPAFGSYAAAWDQYREDNRLTRTAAGSLVSGLLFTVLTLVFFFSIDFGMLWPALLVLVGLSLLAVGLIPG